MQAEEEERNRGQTLTFGTEEFTAAEKPRNTSSGRDSAFIVWKICVLFHAGDTELLMTTLNITVRLRDSYDALVSRST